MPSATPDFDLHHELLETDEAHLINSSPSLHDGPRNGAQGQSPGFKTPEAEPCRIRKRLVILCDGTWQNAECTPEKSAPPTNIIRMARAIKRVTMVANFRQEDEGCEDKKPTETEVHQIVFYQSGVGTGTWDSIIGGSIGVGLSEKVRSGYAFLANNYAPGDSILIFGFSRGAYTARAIAGLVTKMGLLEKKGMDIFPLVYKRYYSMDKSLSGEQERKEWKKARHEFNLSRLPKGTIEVVGVFDTVGFHRPVTGKYSWLNRFIGEQYEMRNTDLPTGVRYAFQALSLDECRIPFKPALWYKPIEVNTTIQKPRFETVLKQCWFSGEHSDIGGGMKNPELSNISLAWMVSQLTEHNLLDFDPNYLLKDNNMDYHECARQRWVTIYGEGGEYAEKQSLFQRVRLAVFWFFANYLMQFAAWLGINSLVGVRTPGMYYRDGFETHEFLHSSIVDRWLEHRGKEQQGTHWTCRSLANWRLLGSTGDDTRVIKNHPKAGTLKRLNGQVSRALGAKLDGYNPSNNGPRVWVKSQNGQTFYLQEDPISDIELRCKNNIRNPNLRYVTDSHFQKLSERRKICDDSHHFDEFNCLLNLNTKGKEKSSHGSSTKKLSLGKEW